MDRRLQFRLPDRRTAFYLIAIFVVSGGLNAFSAWTDYQNAGGTQVWRPIVWEYSSILMLVVLAIPVYQLCEWLEFRQDNWKRRVAQHFGLALVFSVLHVAGMFGIRKLIYTLVGDHYDIGPVKAAFIYELSKDLLTYMSLAFICYGLLFAQRTQRLHRQTLSLQRELAELQLRRLREQLRPHFLFNTLNLISSAMYEDPEKADKLLVDLATLLRYSLNKEDTSRLPLGEERTFLQRYWDLIDARFPGKLSLSWDLEAGCERALLPCFVLQPLVDNAVEHGFRPRGGAGQVRIVARRVGSQLALRVEDDGVGLQITPEVALAKGLGLGNLHAILLQLYGESFELALEPSSIGGLSVRLLLPFEESE